MKSISSSLYFPCLQPLIILLASFQKPLKLPSTKKAIVLDLYYEVSALVMSNMLGCLKTGKEGSGVSNAVLRWPSEGHLWGDGKVIFRD